MPQTYYGILGVALEASDTEIRTAYKQALLRLHPDKVSAAGAPADNQRYQELQTAWAVLREPSTKTAYDQQLGLAAAQQQAFVSQTILLADMELVKLSVENSTHPSADTAHQYPCRCGGVYWLDDIMLHVSQGGVLVQCDTCSSNIEVCLRSP